MSKPTNQWKGFGNRQPKHPGRVYIEKHGYGDNWYKQRARVLRRDKHTCQKCNSERGVSVHHKRKIAWFYDSRDQTMDYEKANDLDNLITLCGRCHKVADGHSKMEGFTYL